MLVQSIEVIAPRYVESIQTHFISVNRQTKTDKERSLNTHQVDAGLEVFRDVIWAKRQGGMLHIWIDRR